VAQAQMRTIFEMLPDSRLRSSSPKQQVDYCNSGFVFGAQVAATSLYVHCAHVGIATRLTSGAQRPLQKPRTTVARRRGISALALGSPPAAAIFTRPALMVIALDAMAPLAAYGAGCVRAQMLRRCGQLPQALAPTPTCTHFRARISLFGQAL